MYASQIRFYELSRIKNTETHIYASIQYCKIHKGYPLRNICVKILNTNINTNADVLTHEY